jgi:hypothetical protein
MSFSRWALGVLLAGCGSTNEVAYAAHVIPKHRYGVVTGGLVKAAVGEVAAGITATDMAHSTSLSGSAEDVEGASLERRIGDETTMSIVLVVGFEDEGGSDDINCAVSRDFLADLADHLGCFPAMAKVGVPGAPDLVRVDNEHPPILSHQMPVNVLSEAS